MYSSSTQREARQKGAGAGSDNIIIITGKEKIWPLPLRGAVFFCAILIHSLMKNGAHYSAICGMYRAPANRFIVAFLKPLPEYRKFHRKTTGDIL
jgi:hypothetical protein